MIKLSDSKRQYKTTINHTGTNSSATYTVNHNLGTDNIQVNMWDPDEDAQIITIYQDPSGNVYGYTVLNLTLTSCDIRIWQWQYTPGSQHTANKTVEVTITAV